jgi:L-threonylcarbamoyladenylate synthase
VNDVEAAGAALRTGRLVVLPTDTVYGVGALPRSRGGVAALFAAKSRSEDKAIPVLAASVEDLADVVVFDDRARALAEKFWPGPLTLVMLRNPAWPYDLGGSDYSTIAVRVPRNPTALALLERTGPLAVTSANRSDEPAATTVARARSALGDAVAVYLEGGVCDEVPSSVVSVVGGVKMLREGPVSLDAVYKVTE